MTLFFYLCDNFFNGVKVMWESVPKKFSVSMSWIAPCVFCVNEVIYPPKRCLGIPSEVRLPMFKWSLTDLLYNMRWIAFFLVMIDNWGWVFEKVKVFEKWVLRQSRRSQSNQGIPFVEICNWVALNVESISVLHHRQTLTASCKLSFSERGRLRKLTEEG